ncbi:MAG: endonuclease III [Chitinophagales bacterium]|nr:endonuclease III [Chitinophagales bacterium]
MAKVIWEEAVKPLLKKYKNKKHPIYYSNIYQLIVVVVLSARATDKYINQLSPKFFKSLPDFESLSNSSPELLYPLIKGVPGFNKKAVWLIEIAKQLKKKKEIPLSIKELSSLPGIGRKSANVIRREAGEKPEGVIVDLHVLRVAPRLGIAEGDDPKKIEDQLMQALPQKDWDAGMAMSFLGREICRPTNPDCPECVMNGVCKYYNKGK